MSRATRIIVTAGLGLISGAVTGMCLPLSGDLIGQAKPEDITWASYLKLVGPGLLFGGLLALAFVRFGLARLGQAAVFILLVEAAWLAAYAFTLAVQGTWPAFWNKWAEIGMAAGAIGGLGLALAALVTFRLGARPGLVAVMVLAGGAVGALFALQPFLQVIDPLFYTWQAVMAAWLGYAVTSAAPALAPQAEAAARDVAAAPAEEPAVAEASARDTRSEATRGVKRQGSGRHRNALPEGTLLAGEYSIRSVLGSGGFGITYLAEDVALHADRAVKEYFPNSFAVREETVRVASRSHDDDEMYRWGLDRFLEEARTLARFNHPSIVRVARVFEENNTAYMVLYYEDGVSFRQWLKDIGRPPTQDELDAVTAPLLDALEVIHANNFLHRDIAPDNIYIRADGSPVLLDFGSARLAIGVRTKALTEIVKPGYSPLEQYESLSEDQGPWSDIYAMGATLYQTVTGKVPPEAIARARKDRYVPLAELAPEGYRAAFLAAIDAALRPNPEERPKTVRTWREMLGL